MNTGFKMTLYKSLFPSCRTKHKCFLFQKSVQIFSFIISCQECNSIKRILFCQIFLLVAFRCQSCSAIDEVSVVLERSVVEIRDWPEQKSSLESSEELKSNATTLVRKTG